jgi:hypothetical protein
MPSDVTHILLLLHLCIILILVLGFYSGLSGRVRTVYVFSLCVVLLLSKSVTASALVWFSDFLKYLVFHFHISLGTVFICRSSWILWFMYKGAFRIDRRFWIESAGGFRCSNWRLSLVAEFYRSTWV